MADRNALDSALVELAAASTALERTARPTLKDVEEARDKAKKAHGILDAAHKLLSANIYTVADAPPSPGVPLDFETVVPPLGLTDPEEHEEHEESETPALPTLDYTEAEVVEPSFSEMLERLEQQGLEGGELALKGWPKAEKAWRDAFLADGPGTYARLKFRLDAPGEITTWEIPTDEEMGGEA